MNSSSFIIGIFLKEFFSDDIDVFFDRLAVQFLVHKNIVKLEEHLKYLFAL